MAELVQSVDKIDTATNVASDLAAKVAYEDTLIRMVNPEGRPESGSLRLHYITQEGDPPGPVDNVLEVAVTKGKCHIDPLAESALNVLGWRRG